MALIIGLTGGIASGKSTVANMFRELNIPVVDADIVAREVVERGEQAYGEIVAAFGKDILHADLTINRAKLGEIIFNDEQKRKKLNEIVHPAIRARMEQYKNEYIAAGHAVVVMDVPLLFESKQQHLYDKVLVVYVDEDVQLQRLMERNNLTKEEALARISSQLPLREKLDKADYVINNNGSIDDTRQQLTHFLEECKII